MLPDQYFDWTNFISQHRLDVPDGVRDVKDKENATRSKWIIPITLRLISKLGVRVLNSGRLCFGGRALKGIFLPKSAAKQISLVKKFLVWYSPCIEVRQKVYQMNGSCFHRRENQFLLMYLRALGYRGVGYRGYVD
jgi:hypothetical protein